MTPTERAEEIADIIFELPRGFDIREKGVRLIAAALTEARAEGFRECQAKAHEVAVKRVDDTPRMDYEAGWSRASELIANEIKALAPEEK